MSGTYGARSAGAPPPRPGGGGVRGGQVKNRAPAPIQITAEQLLREAKDRQIEAAPFKQTHQRITDPEELAEFRQAKRKEFEDAIRYERTRMGTWVKYAHFEEQQGDFKRVRSVFERAIDINYTDRNLWLKYAELEMRNKFVNHARNVWDRAVSLMPRVDQFWFKYSYMEEMLGRIDAARQIFERWMQWEPDDPAWHSYVKFEMRAGQPARARTVHDRYLAVHQTQRAFIKVAKWEARQGEPALSRAVYERAVAEIPADEQTEALFLGFAQLEERCAEHARARAIYRFGLELLPKDQSEELAAEHVRFEKQHGNQRGIEAVILEKRRVQYAAQLEANRHDYDTWFDLVRLEESAAAAAAAEESGDVGGAARERVRETYEQAVSNVPPVAEKRYWRRYIYLWVNYALYEELEAGDAARTRAVWRACLGTVPHKTFTFAKIWLLFAQFEVRQLQLGAARKVLGVALGKCPKDKLFRGYIELEQQLGEIERCRTLYGKYLAHGPHNCAAWRRFAELEQAVGETERCRAIFELAVGQRVLDMPEQIWKCYIDFEIAQGENARAQALYERLLQRTGHVKVWLSFAAFVASAGGGDAAGARAVYERALEALKREGAKEPRAALLAAWQAFEHALGDGNREQLERVNALMPRRIKKKRQVTAEGGALGGWEEYYDYIFPGDEKAAPNLKILEMAHKWKMAKKRKAEELGGEAEGGGDE
eukprot:g4952.t1